MNLLRKKSLGILILATLVIFGGCICALLPNLSNNSQTAAIPVGTRPFEVTGRPPIEVSVPNAGEFGEGLYLCRPESQMAINVYSGTVSLKNLIGNKQNFNPKFQAMVMRNDQWEVIQEWSKMRDGQWQIIKAETELPFYIDPNEDPTVKSVRWYLQETAPASLYGVRCSYKEKLYDDYGKEYDQEFVSDFQVLYTQNFTYIDVVNTKTGLSYYNGFPGGKDMSLTFAITYNPGASDPSLQSLFKKKLSTGVAIGELNNGNIVRAADMEITVKTLSNTVYDSSYVQKEPVVDSNQMDVIFTEPFGRDIYIVQFKSAANGKILGQFIINNMGMSGGVNLSHLWVVLMLFGGLIALFGTGAFLVPLIIMKVNEFRVNRENVRVARQKNPEAYKKEKKGPLLQRIKEKIKYITTPVYKRNKPENAKPEAEAQEGTGVHKFADMINERREKREYMKQYGISSSEVDEMKKREAAVIDDQKRSFAALRDDDDDDIATLHEESDDIQTIETGAYVEDGVKFNKLDSMKDEPNGDDDHDDTTK